MNNRQEKLVRSAAKQLKELRRQQRQQLKQIRNEAEINTTRLEKVIADIDVEIAELEEGTTNG